MKNTQNRKYKAMARAMLKHGGWMGALEIADESGLKKEDVYRGLPGLVEASMKWRGDEVMEARKVQSQRQQGRTVSEHRVRAIAADASPKELLLKHYSRNPELTLHELSQMAGCSIGTAHNERKRLIENGVGVRRERRDRPKKNAVAPGMGEVEQYQQAVMFRQLWPARAAQ